MNTPRETKLTRIFNHLKHVIHADEGLRVRRRDLLSSRQGDIQLELDFGDARSKLAQDRWLSLQNSSSNGFTA